MLVAAASLWAASASADSPLYRLPYPDNHAYTITQAPGGWISSHTTADSRHAIDFAMPEGTPVLAAREGVVVAAEWRHDRGERIGELLTRSNFVRVRHADGTNAIYGHFMHAGVAVLAGERVRAGQVLGYSGATGFASGPHLHFAVTRMQADGDELEEVSIPVRFHVGDPPTAFAPRVGLAVPAIYSGPAEPPLPPLQLRHRVYTPHGDHEGTGLSWFLALAAMLAGLLWFHRFSRS